MIADCCNRWSSCFAPIPPGKEREQWARSEGLFIAGTGGYALGVVFYAISLSSKDNFFFPFSAYYCKTLSVVCYLSAAWNFRKIDLDLAKEFAFSATALVLSILVSEIFMYGLTRWDLPVSKGAEAPLGILLNLAILGAACREIYKKGGYDYTLLRV